MKIHQIINKALVVINMGVYIRLQYASMRIFKFFLKALSQKIFDEKLFKQ